MNKIIWEVDQDGVLVESEEQPNGSASQVEMADLSSTNASQMEQLTEASDASSNRFLNQESSSEPPNPGPEGSPENGNQNVNYKRATQFMKTPCGHRYHPHCLRKWMEIRMECPTCR